MRQELETVVPTLVDFDFKRVVGAGSVVAVVVAQIKRNCRVERPAAYRIARLIP